jgi:hypothetical protein
MKELIICSAIKMNDGYIVKGHRHNDCIRTAMGIPRYKKDKSTMLEQGFVDSRNRFLNREQSATIAFWSEQIDTPLKTLFSENLY